MARFHVPVYVEIEAEDSDAAWEEVMENPVAAVGRSIGGVFVGEPEEDEVV